LQNRRLPHCNRTVVLRVKEASFGGIEASSGDGRGNAIPKHPSVDIIETFELLVALWLEAAWQIPPAPPVARRHSYSHLHPCGARLRKVVQRVAALPGFIKLADGIPDRDC